MSWFFPIFFRTFSNHDFTPNHAVESILVEVTNEFYVDKFKGQFSFLILIHQQHLILRINISFLKHFLHLALRMPHSPSFLLISLAIPSQSPLLVIPPKLLFLYFRDVFKPHLSTYTQLPWGSHPVSLF